VDAARLALNAVNPEVEIAALQSRIDFQAAEKLVAQSDLVLDCTDNFATRQLLNRACVEHRTPLVSGAAIRFDGQVMVFDLRKPDSPCYACLFPEDGEVEEVQCSVMGVFAPLTGIVGATQALEALKLLAGIGESLSGRLLLLDAKNADWRTVRVTRDSSCTVCANR
jgi:adenylyltransferase/sulfurtransferase